MESKDLKVEANKLLNKGLKTTTETFSKVLDKESLNENINKVMTKTKEGHEAYKALPKGKARYVNYLLIGGSILLIVSLWSSSIWFGYYCMGVVLGTIGLGQIPLIKFWLVKGVKIAMLFSGDIFLPENMRDRFANMAIYAAQFLIALFLGTLIAPFFIGYCLYRIFVNPETETIEEEEEEEAIVSEASTPLAFTSKPKKDVPQQKPLRKTTDFIKRT